MANDFIGNLGAALSQQFSNTDNKNAGINIANGNPIFGGGSLGEFASTFDQTTERSYTEEGSFSSEFYYDKPKQLQILMQEPDVTVLVKKRAFASLAESFRVDLADRQDKLFFRATKVLLQNKCKQIAAYERLSKISVITSDLGYVDYHLLPIIFAATDTLTQIPGALGLNSVQSSINGSLSGFANIVGRVREIVALAQDQHYTTWTTGIPDAFNINFAAGTGVIEFTNVTSLSTTTTLNFGEGSFNLHFSDPYELMLITNLDIEQAIYDATNKAYSNSFIQMGIGALDQTISAQKSNLNAMRASRAVAPIAFQITQDPYLGSTVKAFITTTGYNINFTASFTSVTLDPAALESGGAVGNDGLNASEASIFKSIVSMLYTQITTSANTRQRAIADNQDPRQYLNAIRKKLRLHYGNKLLIQPMDNVHIFIGSKKRIDNKIIGGLQGSFAAQGFLQGINNLTQNIKDTFAINENFALEKSLFVGDDFPTWLWMILRNQFISEKNGTQVFAGVVETATSNYSNGAFSVNASGKDNATYFNYGVVNFKPSVDVFNGALYDPLTPFKLEFDSVSGAVKYPPSSGNQPPAPELLDENKAMFDSAFVKNKNGLLAGLVPTEDSFTNQDADRIKNNSVRRVFYDPDGMVYRWKEGIATLVLAGDSYESNPANVMPPAILRDPFAGQDMINVLSLLITGQPYNFTTYYKAVIDWDHGNRDPMSNEDPSGSYYRGLRTQLNSQNAIYGNFIPFKKLVMDDATAVLIQNNQLNAIQYDAELSNLIQQRATLADSLAMLGKTTAASNQASPDGLDSLMAQRLNGIDQQIQNSINNINASLNSSNSIINSVGSDVSYNSDNSGVNTGGSRKDLRRKVEFLTRRIAWKVRANEDKNYLIVDDSYDKDYDIQAFAKIPVDPVLFQSEYNTVKDKIDTVRTAMGGMEVFANTQGHIEVRNPKYNRVPSSVFFKMLQMKNYLGIQIFPQFLEDLYTNQANQLNENIAILEDEIRLYCLALGHGAFSNANAADQDCQNFLNSFGSSAGTTGGFQFISDPNTGTIAGGALNITIQSQPDSMLAAIQTKLSAIEPQASVNAFNTVSAARVIQSTVMPPGSSNTPLQFGNLNTIQANVASTTRQQQILSRLQQAGHPFDFAQLFNNTQNATISSATLSNIDLLQITTNISSNIAARQIAIKQAASALTTVQEGLRMFDGGGGQGDTPGANYALFPALYNSRSIPQVFEHMIEDESYDDLGVGSAKRYVIKNHDIISYSISENRPQFTSIEVTGMLSGQFIENSTLNGNTGLAIGQSGNAMVTALAVDYDLWRMYGMQVPQPINAPWLSDPDTQCAPYGVSLLNQARKQIFGGTIDIIGNEYQQPGEVIYIENRDLLFYVQSVTHNFDFGKRFSTSLNITYGHNPGEYIPTFLDVVGKVLFRNKDTPHLVNKRQGNVFNQEFLGTIIGNTALTDSAGVASDVSTSTIPFGTAADAASASSDASATSSANVGLSITSGPFGDSNRLALQQIIDLAGQSLSAASNNMNPVLEVRVYFNSANGNFSAASSYAKQLQATVMGYLTGANSLDGNTQPTGSPNSNANTLAAFTNAGPGKAPQIKKQDVDSNPTIEGEFRYPSAKAFSFARAITDTTTQGATGATLQQAIDNVIYSYIVDCWIVFNNPQNTTSTDQ
jgi:hypothetical protein